MAVTAGHLHLVDPVEPRRIERSYGRVVAHRAIPTYHSGMRCPACWQADWHVGRITAECAACGHVLPI